VIIEGGTNFTSIEVASYAERGFATNFALGALTLGGTNMGCAVLTNRFGNANSGDFNQEMLAVIRLAQAEHSVLDLNHLGLMVRDAAVLPGELRLSQGTLVASNGLAWATNGTLFGQGLLVGNFTNSGQFILETNAGVLLVNGNLDQASSGILQINIGGVTASNSYDQLVVSGLARLSGALTIKLINGFKPALGNSFEVLRYGSRNGQFQFINLPVLAAG